MCNSRLALELDIQISCCHCYTFFWMPGVIPLLSKCILRPSALCEIETGTAQRHLDLFYFWKIGFLTSVPMPCFSSPLWSKLPLLPLLVLQGPSSTSPKTPLVSFQTIYHTAAEVILKTKSWWNQLPFLNSFHGSPLLGEHYLPAIIRICLFSALLSPQYSVL